MNESANSSQAPGLRARKRAATRAAITTAARTLTAHRGLAGFTIEELCEEVGVSRRTFFNYFPTKEDAILGHLQDEFPGAALADFLSGAEQGGGNGAAQAGTDQAGDAAQAAGGLNRSLLPALFHLTCAVVENMALTRGDQQELIAAMQKEPQLIMKMMGNAESRQREFAALIAQREGLSANDPAAVLAAALFSMCSHKAGVAFFHADNTASFASLLAGHVDHAQQLFHPSPLTIEGPR